jgi:hypothetical protein
MNMPIVRRVARENARQIQPGFAKVGRIVLPLPLAVIANEQQGLFPDKKDKRHALQIFSELVAMDVSPRDLRMLSLRLREMGAWLRMDYLEGRLVRAMGESLAAGKMDPEPAMR